MSEITAAWLRRGHQQIAIKTNEGVLFILDAAGQVDVAVIEIDDSRWSTEWDELYPETDFG